jgi:hypothetical protein
MNELFEVWEARRDGTWRKGGLVWGRAAAESESSRSLTENSDMDDYLVASNLFTGLAASF